MCQSLTNKQLDTIHELLQPASGAPIEVMEGALQALAHDASDRALAIMLQIEDVLPADLHFYWSLARVECEFLNKGPKLDDAIAGLGPLLDLPPAEGDADELQAQCDALQEAFDERGIGFSFHDDESLGRRVAVMRAVYECIGELRFEGEGHCVIDQFFAPENDLLEAQPPVDVRRAC